MHFSIIFKQTTTHTMTRCSHVSHWLRAWVDQWFTDLSQSETGILYMAPPTPHYMKKNIAANAGTEISRIIIQRLIQMNRGEFSNESWILLRTCSADWSFYISHINTCRLCLPLRFFNSLNARRHFNAKIFLLRKRFVIYRVTQIKLYGNQDLILIELTYQE